MIRLKIKKKKIVTPKKDVCGNCGAKYYDILGIGKCAECFYGRLTTIKKD